MSPITVFNSVGFRALRRLIGSKYNEKKLNCYLSGVFYEGGIHVSCHILTLAESFIRHRETVSANPDSSTKS